MLSTKLENAYLKVREYIRNNPEATIIDICEDVKVPFDIVISLVKEGDFILREREGANMVLIRCEGCGVKLLSGRYCKSCAKNLTKNQKETRTGTRYHIQGKE